jgi:hypothetical protein
LVALIVTLTVLLALLVPLTVAGGAGAAMVGTATVAVLLLELTWEPPVWGIEGALSEPLALLVVRLATSELLAVCGVTGAAMKLLMTAPLDVNVPTLPAVEARAVSVAWPMVLPFSDRVKDEPTAENCSVAGLAADPTDPLYV